MSGIQRFFPSKRVSSPGDALKTVINGTGGTVADFGGYRIHTFTSVGSVNFFAGNPGRIEYLILSGGGGGGSHVGGGGGAGGFLNGSLDIISGTHITVVGSGGSGGTNNARGSNGSNSSAFGLTAFGGGGGGTYSGQGTANGIDGGSGGGAGGAEQAARR